MGASTRPNVCDRLVLLARQNDLPLSTTVQAKDRMVGGSRALSVSRVAQLTVSHE